MSGRSFTVGQRVRIKREWRDRPDVPPVSYIVVEDNGDRLIIEAQLEGWWLKPTELVRDYMIEPEDTQS